MVSLSLPLRLLCPALLVCGVTLPGLAQNQNAQPPANYHGPDTYGMCAYVIGDTEYYGRAFYTSSYFRPKAEAEVREYAQSQARGAQFRAHCVWSYKEADLATIKETDRRLIGMPGHPAKSVESGWTFTGGAANGGGSVVGSAPAGATGPTTSATQANLAKRGATSANASGVTSSAAYPSKVGTATAASGATTSGTSGLVSGSQQSLSDAKNNAVSTASSGMTTATNSALGALSSGMQNMFHRKQAQPQQANGAASGGGNNQPSGQSQTVASGGATQEGFGFVADGAAANQGPAANGRVAGAPGTASAAAAAPVEGLIADVSGKDVIINVGSQAGVRAGSTLVVLHAQRTVKDPATGKTLRTIESQVGELKITGVDADSANGVFSGAGVPVVGDKVRDRE